MPCPYCSPSFSAVNVGTFATVGSSPVVATMWAIRIVGSSIPSIAPQKNTTHWSMSSSRYQRFHLDAFSGVSRKVTPTGSSSCRSPRTPAM